MDLLTLPPYPQCVTCHSCRVLVEDAEYRINREGTRIVARRRFRCAECSGVTRDRYDSDPEASKADIKRMRGDV